MFAGVRSVYLTLHDGQQELAVSEMFPDARELDIHVKCSDRRVETLPRLAVNLSGLTLRSLVFDNSDGRPASLKLDGMSWSPVAEVAFTSPVLDPPDGFWPADSARVEFVAFVARAEGAQHTDYGSFEARRPDVLTITVSTRDGTWRCTLRVPFAVAERSALAELAALPTARLTSLVVSESLLGYLLHTDVSLRALRSVHAVDCVVHEGKVNVRGRPVDLRTLTPRAAPE